MICGSTPWTKQQQVQLASGTADDLEPRRMASSRTGVPPELETLVRRSLKCDPLKRPTAAQFSAALVQLARSLDNSPPQLLRKPSEPEPTMDLSVTVWPDDKS
jgi:hypothetical protein